MGWKRGIERVKIYEINLFFYSLKIHNLNKCLYTISINEEILKNLVILIKNKMLVLKIIKKLSVKAIK